MMLYIKTTTDRLELPFIVETSPSILAQKLGLKRRSVATMCSKGVSGFYRVEVEPDLYPDNDGNLWYYDEDGRVVYV